MKGDERVIDLLNSCLADEVHAFHQYTVYASILTHKGYSKLAARIKEEAQEEMQHAEKLIDRIIMLDGKPVMISNEGISLQEEPEAVFKTLLSKEEQALSLYRNLIETAQLVRDYVSARLGEDLLKDEEGHQEWLRTQLELIKRLGFTNYEANLSI